MFTMNKQRLLIVVFWRICLVFCTALGAELGHADVIPGLSCPAGYTELDGVSSLTCVERSLTQAVYPANLDGSCRSSTFVPVEASELCVDRARTAITQNEYGVTIIDPSLGGACARGFKSIKGAYCIANNISIALDGDEAKLVYPILDCAAGSQQLPGDIRCTIIPPANIPTLANPDIGLSCARGFMPIPGKELCIDEAIVKRTNTYINFGLEVPKEDCPSYYEKYNTDGFCVPTHTAIVRNSGGAFGFFSIEIQSGRCVGPVDALPSPLNDLDEIRADIPVCLLVQQGSGSGWPLPD